MMQDQALQDSALKERLVCKYLSCPMFMGVVAAILLILCVVLQPAEVSEHRQHSTHSWIPNAHATERWITEALCACVCVCVCVCVCRQDEYWTGCKGDANGAASAAASATMLAVATACWYLVY